MLQPGTTLQEKYVVEKILGQGGMGAVYLARNTSLAGKRVAIKEMQVAIQDPTARASAVRQFQKEAHMLALLDHPNLVDVSDTFEEGGSQFLVMALIDGVTVESVLTKSPGFLHVAQVLEWMDQLCDVLDFLHSQKPPIIFRDLKPSNIMLDSRNRIRLVDFGIARVFESGGQTTTFIKGAGTPGFSPVEQFGGGSTDARSDVYALGATLYALLTKTVPPVSVMIMTGEDELIPPQAINPSVGPALSAIIVKMMGLRKEERYQTMAEVRRALRAVPKPAASQANDGGHTVVPPHVYCTSCRTTLAPFARACQKCGTSVTAETEEKGPVPPAETTRKPSRSGPQQTLLAKPRRSGGVLIGASVLLLVGVVIGSRFIKPAPPPAVLDVRSQPPGASVKVDGAFKGNAPIKLENLGAGAHEVEMSLPGYRSQKTAVTLEAGQVAPLEIGMQSNPGEIVLEATPDGVDLMVDGKALGTNLSRGSRVAVDPGVHQVEIRRTHYQTYRNSVTVAADRTITISTALKPSVGTLRVESVPSGARVVVAGKAAGSTPLTLSQMLPGKLEIRVEKDGFKTISQSVEVRSDETVPLKVTLPALPPPEAPRPVYVAPAYRPHPVYQAPRPAVPDSHSHSF